MSISIKNHILLIINYCSLSGRMIVNYFSYSIMDWHNQLFKFFFQKKKYLFLFYKINGLVQMHHKRRENISATRHPISSQSYTTLQRNILVKIKKRELSLGTRPQLYIYRHTIVNYY